MKIAITSPYDFSVPGGVQTHIVELSRELSQRGNEVTIFAPLSLTNIHTLDGVEFIDLGKPVTFSFLGSKTRISLNIFKIIKSIKIIRKNNFDIIHIHEPLIPSQILINIFTNITKIATFHAYSDKKNYVYYYLNFILKFMVKRLSYKICVSKFSQKYINKYFSFNSSIIPNGINVNNFSNTLRTTKKINNTSTKICFIGRFDEPRKGFSTLLSSFIELKKEYQELKLVVAGPGDKKIFSNQINNDISFLGTINQNDLPDLYKKVDIVCLPSLSNESFGIVILESMASASILVASDIESYKDILNKNNYGFMFNVGSSTHLSKVLSQIISKEIETKENIENGLKNVLKYSWVKIVSEIINIYSNEIKTNHRGKI